LEVIIAKFNGNYSAYVGIDWALMKPLAKSYREKYQHYLSSLNDYLKESEINA
jgi:uncharacterized membrane-anchored protein YhcB (DUF1043 family)